MKVNLDENLKSAIHHIISNANYETSPEIEVTEGCRTGDAYTSKTYAISIKGENRETVDIFAKCIQENASAEWRSELNPVFQTELKFYQEIYPVFDKFQQKSNIKEPFNNVPRHYRTNISDCECPPIILENLRSSGYMLRDRKKSVDRDHLKLPIQAFARFHAISYPLNDQEPEVYQKLTTKVKGLLTRNFQNYKMDDMVVKCVDQLLSSLDPVSDKKILNHSKKLSDVLIQHFLNIASKTDEYSVITQGDCWSSNMMFLYDDQSGLPIDVKPIAWQYLRVHSPLLDFSYFFYTLATKETLENADYYLHFYYETLSQRIKELGSDPKKMYPYEKFIEHWRKFALFGLTMAVFIVKILLYQNDEIPELLSFTETSTDSFCAVLKDQDKYINRIRDLVEYFIDKKLL